MDLPSLTRRSILLNPFEKHLFYWDEWEGWTSTDQPIVVSRSTIDRQLSIVVYNPDTGQPQVVHQVEQGEFEPLQDWHAAVSPRTPLLALAYCEPVIREEDAWNENLRPSHNAVVVDLVTGRLHPVVDG